MAWAAAAALASCSRKGESTAPRGDAGDPPGLVTDAGLASDGGPRLPPPPPFRGTFLEVVDAGSCSMLLGATCDGPEDCPAGTTCCGRLDGIGFTYVSIECTARCDRNGQTPLCHAGAPCGPEGTTCQTSPLLPFEFMGICGPPVWGPQPEPAGPGEPGRVACGADRCDTSNEHCCLGVGPGAAPFVLEAREPYCAAAGDACACAPARPGPAPGDASSDAALEDASAGE